MILTESGMLYSFGYASHGQLGIGGVKNLSAPCPTKPFLAPTALGFDEFEE